MEWSTELDKNRNTVYKHYKEEYAIRQSLENDKIKYSVVNYKTGSEFWPNTLEEAKEYVEKKYRVPPKVGDVVERKWGKYEILAIGDGFLVKKLTFNPGGTLSYQKHFLRKEGWVLVKGDGVFRTETRNRIYTGYPYFEEFNLWGRPNYVGNIESRTNKKIGDVINIDFQQWHQFIAGSSGAEIIETWVGELDENDIERTDK